MSVSVTTSTKLSRLQLASEALGAPSDARSLLVVEDSRAVREMLCGFLRELGGFTLETAGSLAEARRLIAHDPERFFCAALDLNLPDAPSGEIVDLVQAAGVPSIVLTGTADDGVRQAVLKKNVVDYVIKSTNHQIEHVAYLIGRLRENRGKKVLVVDDSRSYRAYLKHLLDRYFYQTFEAGDGVDALAVLAEHPDMALILTDLNMPRLDGFGLIDEVRKRYRREDLAIIGLSDMSQPGMSARILKAGGNDFLAKSFELEEFYCRITQSTNLVGYVRHIHNTANRDFLTGVYNRRYLFEIGETLYANARRGNIQIAASLIDADHFKRINDTHGHQVGDAALKEIAARLRASFRRTDVVARYGGEEFVCIAILKERAHAFEVFERVRRGLEEIRIETPAGPLGLSASIGITTVLGGSLEEMLKRADEAVYAAKNAGRNRVVEL